jgi:deoxyadenosine/deoxycytidine kinase
MDTHKHYMGLGIIEIIGPPGVGKTTLYDALCLQWKPSCSWTHQDAVLTPTPPFADFKNWIEYKIRKSFKRKLSKAVPNEFGLRFAQLHPGLADFCWQRLSAEHFDGKTGTEMRFRSAFLLYSDFCRYQAIAEKNSFIPCILSEGLLQKSFLIQSDAGIMSDLLNTYLMLVPLPSAVIYINGSKEMIVERLMSRKKLLPTHRGKSRNELLENIVHWQHQCQLTVTWMSDHSVPVYSLDGAKPIKENVSSLVRILEKQEYGPAFSRDKKTNQDAAHVVLPQ